MLSPFSEAAFGEQIIKYVETSLTSPVASGHTGKAIDSFSAICIMATRGRFIAGTGGRGALRRITSKAT